MLWKCCTQYASKFRKLNIQKTKIIASSPITSWHFVFMRKQRKQWETLFWGAPKSLQMVTAAWNWKTLAPWKKSYDQPGQLEKAMAPHSSTLAWKIPWTAEPGRLQSMGSLRVGHNWATSLSLFIFTHWRRKWQPTPVFLPGESWGQGSVVGFHLWGHTESDMTKAT